MRQAQHQNNLGVIALCLLGAVKNTSCTSQTIVYVWFNPLATGPGYLRVFISLLAQ